MRRLRLSARLRPIGFLAFLLPLSACSDQSSEPTTGPRAPLAASAAGGQPDIAAALQAKTRHLARLMATPGVTGVAVGLNPAGRAVVKVFTERPAVAGIPTDLDQVPVAIEVTGRAYALSDPTTRQRPAPVGFSVGHPSITAGTIGARVKDLAGNVYVLSNNHVLAAINSGQIGDATLQPGPYDGGTDPADRIGTLFDYETLNLGFNQYGVPPPSNVMDAAIALSTTTALDNSTPTDDGYGTPNPLIYGDANNDTLFDNPAALLNLAVQKYGRTTKLTKGQVTEVAVTIDVCYDIFCLSIGRFNDQVGVCCAGFSDGGDSGSLIVSDDANRNPVALLFAGDGTRTYGNRIDFVLRRFHVSIDGSSSPPPPPPAATMHVGSLDGLATSQGRTWTAVITVLIVDAGLAPVSGAQVSGTFSGVTKASSCTTGSTGICTLTKSRLRTGSVSFTVTGVTRSGFTYDPSGNQKTTVTVARP
jgi:hypothetical protein